MQRARRMLATLGWLLAGAIVGPPAIGAASTAFWNEAADGNTAVGVASRVYDRVYPPTVGPALVREEERLPDVSLGASCSKPYQQGMASADLGPILLHDVIRAYSSQRLFGLLKSGPSHRALLSMPRPLLGALDVCIGGSPVAGPLCQAYVRRITDEAQAKTSATTKNALVETVRRETDAIWCAAAGVHRTEK